MKSFDLKYFKTILILVAIMWAAYFLSWILPLNNFGIVPRTVPGLIGIISSPFLHANINHIMANTISILIFGLVFTMLEKRNSLFIIIVIVLIGGLGTWIFARSATHIGASGLIFGLYGYLLLAGIFKKKFVYIIVSVALLILFGAMLYGVLPTQKCVSWEGHLFGFIAGGLCAKFLK